MRKLSRTEQVARALYCMDTGPYDFNADPKGWFKNRFMRMARIAIRIADNTRQQETSDVH